MTLYKISHGAKPLFLKSQMEWFLIGHNYNLFGLHILHYLLTACVDCYIFVLYFAVLYFNLILLTSIHTWIKYVYATDNRLELLACRTVAPVWFNSPYLARLLITTENPTLSVLYRTSNTARKKSMFSEKRR